jgi:hypothetical protein
MGIKPSDKNPITKFDVKRLCALLGRDINDTMALTCLSYLDIRNATGRRFSARLFFKWWVEAI